MVNIFTEARRIADHIGLASDRFVRRLCKDVSKATGRVISTEQVYGHAQSVYARKVS